MVMALSLLSLVFLLVISLINLVGTDLSLSEVRKERILAKAHARVGMMVAIGEIQKHLGPDTRVTATADILDERIESGSLYASSQNYDEESDLFGFNDGEDRNQIIDLNEDGNLDKVPFGQRHWTGVWKHRARSRNTDSAKRGAKPLPKNYETAQGIKISAQYDSEYDPHPAVELAWLVSGNEGYHKKLFVGEDTDNFQEFLENPSGLWDESTLDNGRRMVNGGVYGKHRNGWKDYSETLGLDENGNFDQGRSELYKHPEFGTYAHPLIPTEEDYEWLLKSPLLSSDYDHELHREQWQDFLRSEPVLAPKTRLDVDGVPIERSGRIINKPSYAYWVGDEGVKSKVNISNPNADSNEEDKIRDNITVSAVPNLSLYDDTDDASEGPVKGGFGFSMDDEDREKILSVESMKLLVGDNSSDEELGDLVSAHYHSLTTTSHGVLADVRTGGLRRDLSSAFALDEKMNDNRWDDHIIDDSKAWSRDFEDYLYRHKVKLERTTPAFDDLKTINNLTYNAVRSNKWADDPEDSSSGGIGWEGAILAGPRWSVLGAFHNLYANNTDSDSEFRDVLPCHPNCSIPGHSEKTMCGVFPRSVGDNSLLLGLTGGLGPFKQIISFFRGGREEIWARWNFFKELNIRPEPKNHPLQPILTEFKFSQTPTIEGSNLALAMYPSVALWNPYNVSISMEELYVEIPFRDNRLLAANPKDYDRWRKWRMYFSHELDDIGTGGPGNPPPPSPPTLPPNYGLRGSAGLLGPYGPVSAFGKLMLAQNAGVYGLVQNYRSNEFFDRYLQPERLVSLQLSTNINPETNQWMRGGTPPFLRENGQTRPDPNKFKIFCSRDYTNYNSNQKQVILSDYNSHRLERHLLLKLTNLQLGPGEKSHFCVAGKQSWNWTSIPSPGSGKKFLVVDLAKGFDKDPFLCVTDYPVSSSPLYLKYKIGRIRGSKPIETHFRDGSGAKTKNPSKLPYLRGITLYSQKPYTGTAIEVDAISPEETSVIQRINRRFDSHIWLNETRQGSRNMWNTRDQYLSILNPLSELASTSDSNQWGDDLMPGNGFRIRMELPGLAKSVVFEQFNPRALNHGYQEGFGDSWKLEKFIALGANGQIVDVLSKPANPDRRYAIENQNPNGRTITFNPGYDIPAGSEPNEFVDFYDMPTIIPENSNLGINDILDSTTPQYDPNALSKKQNLMWPVVPRISPNGGEGIGDFHDESESHGPMELSSNAVMFEIPDSPMLSIIQLRHANLNNYLHGPAYALGNSYSTSQVSREKPWSRLRGISKQPKDVTTFNTQHNLTMAGHFNTIYGPHGIKNPFYRWLEIYDYGPEYGVSVPMRDAAVGKDNQNTILDHSYFNNLALLDGFFMSGLGSGDALDLDEESETDGRIRPFRNNRLVPYFRDREWDAMDRAESQRYQTLAGDLLAEGIFNVNSTSVDAWISQLSSLAGLDIPKIDGGIHDISDDEDDPEIPFPRFLRYPDDADKTGQSSSSWHEIRVLDKDEITLLAHCLVEQIKLRGPFLSYADFANRRLQGTGKSRLLDHFNDWPQANSEEGENRDSVLGLRGAVQAAIAEAELNQDEFEKPTGAPSMRGAWEHNPMIPTIPSKRFQSNGLISSSYPTGDEYRLLASRFGVHAFHSDWENYTDSRDGSTNRQTLLFPPYLNQARNSDYQVRKQSFFGKGNTYISNKLENLILPDPVNLALNWKLETFDYTESFKYGEAPENLLAVENAATGANKPGWLMQSDVLSPLAPVTSVRSDTFTVRVMGETWSELSADSQKVYKPSSKAWIELTVQRTPDYVKADLDEPHHRPHEPFEDRNFNGFWDDDPNLEEHWLDLNENSKDLTGADDVYQPDLPGGDSSIYYRHGLSSDRRLNRDETEETSGNGTSIHGINQRFGRKFKIISFRWLNVQDV